MLSDALPDSAFQELNKYLLGFDSRATAVSLQSELKCLAAQWPRLKMSALEEYIVRMVGDGQSFSVLKHIKSQIRSTQSQEHLEAFMLMSTEKDILMSLDNDLVIDRVAGNSDLLKKLLIP